MTRTRAAIVAAGFTLSIALAGCGGDAEPTVASAAGAATASASPSGGGGAIAAYVEAKRKWVGCMREQGFDLPDPDAKGQIEISGDTNRRFKADPRYLTANEACAEFNVEVPAELQPHRVQTPEQIANAREAAKCMRENGVPDYPDPDANGNMPENWGGGENTPQREAATQRALQICEPVRQGLPRGTYDPNKKVQG
jgi:hypothetical protein